MRGRVLGNVRLRSGAGEFALPGGQVGALLAYLLALPNRVHSVAELTSYLWPHETVVGPDRLRVVVARARAFLRDGDEGGLRIVTAGGGYRLDANAASLDSVAFQELAHEVLAGDRSRLDEVLELWQGEPLADAPMAAALHQARRELAALRRAVREVATVQPSLREQLARTKFFPPRLMSSMVARPRLLDAIGAVGENRVVVVSAAAGFGKSVLLAQWADGQQAPVAWLTLDRMDRDPGRVWTAIQEALIVGGVLEKALPGEPGSASFLDAAASELNGRSHPAAVVVDDCHHASSADVGWWLTEYGGLLPETLTLVLASRTPITAPPVERTLSASELRFTPQEASAVLGFEVEGDGLPADGWPMGVAMLGRVGAERAKGLLADYVIDEVVEALPGRGRRLMTQTASLRYLHPELCDAVTGETGSEALLEDMAARGILVSGVEAGWYRHHEVFGEALQVRAALEIGDGVDELVSRAAAWCVGEGFEELALEYAVEAGDKELVAALAGPVVGTLAARGEVTTVQELVVRLDPDLVQASRFSHDVTTFYAATWLDPVVSHQWVEHRRAHSAGVDDVILLLADALRHLRWGRLVEASNVIARAADAVEPYFTAHPESMGLRWAVETAVAATDLTIRTSNGSIQHDDPGFNRLRRSLAGRGSLADSWLAGEQALLAFLTGRPEHAATIMSAVEGSLKQVGPQALEVGAPRAVVAEALAESARLPAGKDQRTIQSRLARVAEQYARLGWYVDLLSVQLALHVVSARAGDLPAAADWLDAFDQNPAVATCHVLNHGRDVLALLPGKGQLAAPGVELTDRQAAVLAELVAGLTYREIAAALGISPGAVRSALRAVYRKLGVANRYEAAARISTSVPGQDSAQL